MKKTKKENQSAGGNRNTGDHSKTRTAKNSRGNGGDKEKGAELFRNGTGPNENEDRDITENDDYRLRANRQESRDESGKGNQSKERQPDSNRSMSDSVQAEMGIRSGGNNRQGKTSTRNAGKGK